MRGRRVRRRSGAGRSGIGAKVAVVAGLVLVALSVVAPAADANYARIEARTGCDRVVSWTASASTEGSDAERTNARVVVEYRAAPTAAADEEPDWSSAGPEGSFSPANAFRFSGSVELPDGVDGIELRVQPKVRWGPASDGAEPGAPRFASTEVPSGCRERPLVATQQLDCAIGAVRVSARNVGDAPLGAEVVVDQVVAREVELGPGGVAEVTVPVLAGRATQIQVRAGSFVASDQISGEGCEPPGPTAMVQERCASTLGRLVVRATTTDAPAELQVKVRGTTVDTSTVRPGEITQRTLEVPTGDLALEVTIDGTVAAAGMVGGCTGPVAGLLSCGTSGWPACELSETRPPPIGQPPTPPPPVQLDDGGAGLPRTGPAQRALGLLLGGSLLLGGGMTLSARDRRRPRPSLLNAALEPYRQRWWDQP